MPELLSTPSLFAMATKSDIDPSNLAELIGTSVQSGLSKLVIVDCRCFLDYNDSHIRSAVNAFYSKLVRRRLQENKMCPYELISQLARDKESEEVQPVDLILYDQAATVGAPPAKGAAVTSLAQRRRTTAVCPLQTGDLLRDSNTFLGLLMDKLGSSAKFNRVLRLKGGFLDFQSRYPELCEGPMGGESPAQLSLSSLSQPCLPVSNKGPTKVLPFLYLGSEQDAIDQHTLQSFGIAYVINMSISCRRPDFLADERFMRISVNDSYQERLLPHFDAAFAFLDKVRESNGCVLVHCYKGISRSPTLAIAYIMRHLHMGADEAYAFVKNKRPSISPNLNFMGQLLAFERELNASRSRAFEEKLRTTMRRVLVPCANDALPAAAAAAAALDADLAAQSDSETAAARDDAAIRRSLSCPLKIHKSASTTELSPRSGRWDELEQHSPASVTNSNGKRQMRPSRLPSDAPMDDDDAAPAVIVTVTPPVAVRPVGFAPVERPSGLCGLAARRQLNAVHEDLPSPSTELQKLTFDSLCSPLATDASKTLAGHLTPTAAGERQDSGRDTAPNSPRASDQVVQMVTSAVNPFFVAFAGANAAPSSTPKPPDLPFSGCDQSSSTSSSYATSLSTASRSPLPELSTAASPPLPPKMRAHPSPRGLSESQPAPTNVENPLFPRSTDPQRSLRPVATRCRKPGAVVGRRLLPTSESNVGAESTARRLSSSFAARLASLLRRANNPIQPPAASTVARASVAFGVFCRSPKGPSTSRAVAMARSSTSAGLGGSQQLPSAAANVAAPPLSPPSKSRSESAHLYALCDDLDSPESGFVEPCARDADRESISSTSSIEIAVI